ncbi:MAG: 1-phosphofructokinase family hexose kinase [Candidatus Omnitrophica bacterium]|nr:1-phosphofructokinase family hexose kinase [Candidatus Omnitrophota bacterium]
MTQVHSILTVTLNPTIDKIIAVPVLNIGADHQAIDISHSAGGKGINVARALKCLGLKSIVTGFAGGANGQSFLRALLLEGIEHHFVFIQGETRINVTIQDQQTSQTTRFLEAGPIIDQKDLASFRHKFNRLAENREWIVLSGRGINASPPEFYRELVKVAQNNGGKVLVDASGSDLCSALKGRPFLVKINHDEAQMLLKRKLRSYQHLKDALKQLLSLGAARAIISLGTKGAVASDGQQYWRASGPQIKTVNVLGSGDAMMAGLLFALTQKSNFGGAIAFAVAAGTANVLTSVPGQLDSAQLAVIQQQVTLKNI